MKLALALLIAFTSPLAHAASLSCVASQVQNLQFLGGGLGLQRHPQVEVSETSLRVGRVRYSASRGHQIYASPRSIEMLHSSRDFSFMIQLAADGKSGELYGRYDAEDSVLLAKLLCK